MKRQPNATDGLLYQHDSASNASINNKLVDDST